MERVYHGIISAAVWAFGHTGYSTESPVVTEENHGWYPAIETVQSEETGGKTNTRKPVEKLPEKRNKILRVEISIDRS